MVIMKYVAYYEDNGRFLKWTRRLDGNIDFGGGNLAEAAKFTEEELFELYDHIGYWPDAYTENYQGRNVKILSEDEAIIKDIIE